MDLWVGQRYVSLRHVSLDELVTTVSASALSARLILGAELWGLLRSEPGMCLWCLRGNLPFVTLYIARLISKSEWVRLTAEEFRRFLGYCGKQDDMDWRQGF